MASYTVREVAEVMSVHPRTIWRAYMDDRNPPNWSESDDYNPTVDLDVIAERFGAKPDVLKKAIEGKDILLSQIHTAEKLGVHIRTFKHRKYPVAMRRGGVVRYSWHDVTHYHLKHHVKDDLDSLR